MDDKPDELQASIDRLSDVLTKAGDVNQRLIDALRPLQASIESLRPFLRGQTDQAKTDPKKPASPFEQFTAHLSKLFDSLFPRLAGDRQGLGKAWNGPNAKALRGMAGKAFRGVGRMFGGGKKGAEAAGKASRTTALANATKNAGGLPKVPGVMPGVGSAAGGAEAGAGAGAAGGAGAGAAGPLAVVGIVVAAVAGLVGFSRATAAGTSKLEEHSRALGELSAAMAVVVKQAEARDVFRQREIGDRSAEAAKFFTDQAQQRKDNQKEIDILQERLGYGIQGLKESIVNQLSRPLNALAARLNRALDKYLGAAAEGDVLTSWQMMQEGANRANQQDERQARERERLAKEEAAKR